MRVKELLKQKGMTAKELAAKLNISDAALSLSLSGNPTLERLQEIATALDVSVGELFEPSAKGVIVCPHCGNSIQIEALKGE